MTKVKKRESRKKEKIGDRAFFYGDIFRAKKIDDSKIIDFNCFLFVRSFTTVPYRVCKNLRNNDEPLIVMKRVFIHSVQTVLKATKDDNNDDAIFCFAFKKQTNPFLSLSLSLLTLS